MGLPQIIVKFQDAISSFGSRSNRGVVMVLLDDATDDTFKGGSYGRYEDIDKEQYTEASLEILQLVFRGYEDSIQSRTLNPNKVIVKPYDSATDATENTFSLVLNSVANTRFNFLVAPNASSDNTAVLETFVSDRLNKFYKPCVAVVSTQPSSTALLPYFVWYNSDNVATDIQKINADGTVVASEVVFRKGAFVARIAGLLASIPVGQSATYAVLRDVVSFTESPTANEDIDAGQLILINDGEKIKIARGVTAVSSSDATYNRYYKKIKTVEDMNTLIDDIRTNFSDNYVGKVVNSYENKLLFISSVNTYFRGLERTGVLYTSPTTLNECQIDEQAQRAYLISVLGEAKVSGMSDQQILQYNTDDQVFIKATVSLADVMEELTFIISLNLDTV